MEIVVQAIGSRRLDAEQFALGAPEVERQRRDPAPTLQPRRRLPLLPDEAVDADSHESAESGASRVESGEELLLQRSREELLRPLLRAIGVGAPLKAKVLVDRFPIGLDDPLERALADRSLVAAHRRHDRRSGERKATR
jgi:hypothetical protein